LPQKINSPRPERHNLTHLIMVLPMTRFPTVDPAPERELRERLGDVLLAGREASEEEALLVGLLGPLARIDSLWLGSAQSCAQAREGRRRTMRRGQRGARRDPCGASRSRRGHRHRRGKLHHRQLAPNHPLPALLLTWRRAAGERAERSARASAVPSAQLDAAVRRGPLVRRQSRSGALDPWHVVFGHNAAQPPRSGHVVALGRGQSALVLGGGCRRAARLDVAAALKRGLVSKWGVLVRHQDDKPIP